MVPPDLRRHRTFYHALLESANAEGRYVRLIVPGPRATVEDVGAFGRIYQVPAPPAPVFDRRYRIFLPHTYVPWLPSRVVCRRHSRGSWT